LGRDSKDQSETILDTIASYGAMSARDGATDLVAVMNISRRGWVRFVQSKGGAGEAMRGNAEHDGEPLILRVDASKSGNWQKPET
jgi:hypothetical protein